MYKNTLFRYGKRGRENKKHLFLPNNRTIILSSRLKCLLLESKLNMESWEIRKRIVTTKH